MKESHSANLNEIKLLVNQQKFHDAYKDICTYLKIRPNKAEALLLGAFLANKLEKYSKSENLLKKAIEINPRNIGARVNLSSVLYKLEKFSESKKIIIQTLNLRIEDPNINSQLGSLAYRLGLFEESKLFISQAIKKSSNKRELLYRLSFSYLALGLVDDGWALFENRIGIITQNSVRFIPRIIYNKSDYWKGENLQMKSLLVVYEQGFGDFIQFLPYVLNLKKNFHFRLKIVCKKQLIPLLKNITEIDEIYDDEDKISLEKINFDFWVFIMSLPNIFSNINLKHEVNTPYIDSNKQIFTQQELRKDKKLSVGIVWKGNPNHKNDKYRSISDMSLIKKISKVDSINFYSLQINEEIKQFGAINLISLDGYIDNFQDTVNIVSSLDLVIAVDTSIVHLCGAMNKECWLLLSRVNTDWRWVKETSTQYNSVKIFMQKEYNFWGDVIDEVCFELKKLTT